MPVVFEFVTVKGGPLGDEGECSWREAASEHLAGLDRDGDLMSRVPSGEVRRQVIIRVHLNDDSVEAADLWHGPTSVVVGGRKMVSGQAWPRLTARSTAPG